MHSSKTFCPLPWIHIATRPNGDVRLCCTSNASGAGMIDDKRAGLIKKDGIEMNLRDNTVEEIWNSDFMKETRLDMLNDIIPTSCTKCFEEENKGIVSKRQWETKVWEQRINLSSIVSKTEADGTLPVDIPYFDLRLGNMCQLKCIMCSPHDSSSWIKDWKIQFPLYNNKILKSDQGWNVHYDYTWYQKGSFLDTMKSQAHNIKELYFAGGEPLIIPEHRKILEFMVDSGNAKNCILRYNSNGIEITETILSLWNNFKQVKFNFSIDAYGDKNDYIRFPSQWNTIESNLRLLDDTPDNVIVNVACAVQLLNVLYIDELAHWKMNSNFKKINQSPFGAGVIGLHLVYFPSYLNIRVLPMHLKLLVESKINKFCKTRHTEDFFSNSYGMQRWLGIVKYMMAEDWSSKIPALKEYLTITDSQRNLNYTKVFPELDNL